MGMPPEAVGAFKWVWLVNEDPDGDGDGQLTEVCRKYNSDVCRGDCRRAHACLRCGEVGHGFSSCPTDSADLRWPTWREMHGPHGKR